MAVVAISAEPVASGHDVIHDGGYFDNEGLTIP
jgi:hypothetical protein